MWGVTISGRAMKSTRTCALISLVGLTSACGVSDIGRPRTQILEAEVAECLGIDIESVTVVQLSDGESFSVGVSNGEDTSWTERREECIDPVLDG